MNAFGATGAKSGKYTKAGSVRSEVEVVIRAGIGLPAAEVVVLGVATMGKSVEYSVAVASDADQGWCVGKAVAEYSRGAISGAPPNDALTRVE